MSLPHLEKAREWAAVIGDDWQKFAGVALQIREETVHMDEKLVPAYTLPSALDLPGNTRIRNAGEWSNKRRQEVLELFKNEMYGQIPPRPDHLEFEVLSCKEGALNGLALRKEVRITCSMNNGQKHAFDLLLYLPLGAQKPVPVFAGLNFKGNHACTVEEDVTMTPVRFNDGRFATAEEALAFYGKEKMLTVRNPAFYAPEQRGCQAGRWCFEELVKRGYGAVTACYEDICPDGANGWEFSALSLFEDLTGHVGYHPRYTAIGAWAWGLSRIMDYLESCPEVEASRVAVHGHSRLGKTALWTGATDPRFKLVISNDSGCGGAAVSRRAYGENWLVICNYFPHWFVTASRKYMGNEDQMPFDQHWLISLMAPRPVAVASATEDQWADPRGEFLSALNAREVYALFGSQGLPENEMPPAGKFLTGDVSYHLREGKHDQTPEDWAHYLEIADIYLK